LELNEEAFMKYSMELAMITLVIGMRMWMKSKISADIKDMVREAVADSFYREVFSAKNDNAFISTCKDFFNEHYHSFYELCPHIDGKNKEKQQRELIGMARYLCAQVSNKTEEQNTAVFEKLTLVFIHILTLSEILTRNSSLDIQFPIGKPKFIVQK